MATRPPDDRWATPRAVRIVLGREGEAVGGGEAAGVQGRDGIDGQGGGGEQAVGGALGGSAQALFALGEGQLDRVDVRRGGRQEEEPATDGLDGRVGVRTLVGTEIVQHHDLARAQAGGENALGVGDEGRPIHRSWDRHGRTDACGGEGR